MSFFGSMLGSLAGRAIVPLVAAAGFGAYKSGALDSMSIPGATAAPPYYEMQARITAVENACHLQYRSDGKLRQTKALDCDRATAMLRNPDFAHYTLKKSERIKYSYFSMDGRSTLVGTLDKIRASNGQLYRVNDVITIRVDAKNHSNSTVI